MCDCWMLNECVGNHDVELFLPDIVLPQISPIKVD